VRRAVLFALMMTLLLTACGGDGEKDEAQLLQQQYAAVAAAELAADIICHYGDEVREYSLTCDYTPETSRVTVTAPEELAGISAEVADGRLQLDYNEISMDAGTYSGGGLSPVTVLPELMQAAAEGYIAEMSREERGGQQCLRLGFDMSSDMSRVYTTWFESESMLPLYSEVCWNGEVVYRVTWSRFAVTEQKQVEDPTANG